MDNYKGIQKFRVEHEPTGGEIDVQIDFDFKYKLGDREVTVLECIVEMQSFFTDSEDRLEEADGDVVRAFLKQLCHKVMLMAIEYQRNASGIIRLFDDGEEGYCKMDGSNGIKLLSVDQPDFSYQNDYQIISI